MPTQSQDVFHDLSLWLAPPGLKSLPVQLAPGLVYFHNKPARFRTRASVKQKKIDRNGDTGYQSYRGPQAEAGGHDQEVRG